MKEKEVAEVGTVTDFGIWESGLRWWLFGDESGDGVWQEDGEKDSCGWLTLMAESFGCLIFFFKSFFLIFFFFLLFFSIFFFTDFFIFFEIFSFQILNQKKEKRKEDGWRICWILSSDTRFEVGWKMHKAFLLRFGYLEVK